MKVFISWSGAQAQQVAVALRDWLKAVVQAAEPWASPTDILAGDRWSTEIGLQLEASNFGVICVTPGNQDAPWLNFEAGALSKNVGVARVVPYLHGLTVANLHSGPLKQFHAKEATRHGTWELVLSLNSSVPSPLKEQLLSEVFASMWPVLEAKLTSITVPPEDQALARRSVDDKVDELLETVRNQDARLEKVQGIYRDVGFLMDRVIESGGGFSARELPARLMRMMGLQARAFAKPARIDVDEAAGRLTLTYAAVHSFHYKQMLRFEDDLAEALRRITGGRYRLQLVGPAPGAEDDLPWTPVDEEP